MRYFVIGDDGQKYGPADVPTLQGWINEGRLLPNQQVEEEASGMRIAAAAVNGLKFPLANPTVGAAAGPGTGPQVPTGSPYGGAYSQPVGMQSASGDDGKGDLTIAWVLAGVGAFFCLCGIVLQPIALIFANKAISKGHPGGNAVKIFSIIFLCLSVIFLIFYIVIGKAMMSGAGNFPPPQTFKAQ